MKIEFFLQKKRYQVNTASGIDISCPIRHGTNNIHAWYVGDPTITPVMDNGWIGSVRDGGQVNFRNICFNPHGHGTHTETAEHVMDKKIPVNKYLQDFLVPALLQTFKPEKIGNDSIITKKQIQQCKIKPFHEALIIRTLPNPPNKKTRNYSNTNPPYFAADAIEYIREIGIKHLLTDLPSIDKEKDEGKLAGHHIFWNTKKRILKHHTITEFVFVPNRVLDGSFILNLQIAPFENDAAPSRPIIFPLASAK